MKNIALLSYADAKNIVQEGKILLYPTETYYAIGCAIFSPYVFDIYRIKKRDYTKPLLLIANTVAQISKIAHVCSMAMEVYRYFQQISIIMPLRESVISHQIPHSKKYVQNTNDTDSQTECAPLSLFTPFSRDDTVAVRLAVSPFLRYITQETPIFSTSANYSGKASTAVYTEIEEDLLHTLPTYIPTSIEDTPQGIAPSTIISIYKNTLRIEREGTIHKEDLVAKGFIVE